jgi:hypothetical protein
MGIGMAVAMAMARRKAFMPMVMVTGMAING